MLHLNQGSLNGGCTSTSKKPTAESDSVQASPLSRHGYWLFTGWVLFNDHDATGVVTCADCASVWFVCSEQPCNCCSIPSLIESSHQVPGLLGGLLSQQMSGLADGQGYLRWEGLARLSSHCKTFG